MPSVAAQVLQSRQQQQPPQQSPTANSDNGSGSNVGVPIVLAIIAAVALALTGYLIFRLKRRNKLDNKANSSLISNPTANSNSASYVADMSTINGTSRPSTQPADKQLSAESAFAEDPPGILKRSDTSDTTKSTQSNESTAVVVVPTLTRYSVVPEYGEIRSSTIQPYPASSSQQQRRQSRAAPVPTSGNVQSYPFLNNDARRESVINAELNGGRNQHRRSRTLPIASEGEEEKNEVTTTESRTARPNNAWKRDTDATLYSERQSMFMTPRTAVEVMPMPQPGTYGGRPLSAFMQEQPPMPPPPYGPRGSVAVPPLNSNTFATATGSSLRSGGATDTSSFTLQQQMRKRVGQLKPSIKRKERPQSLLLAPPALKPDVIISVTPTPGPGGFVID